MRKPYDTPYESDSPDAVWTNARVGEGYEIRMDAANRLNVYRVGISYKDAENTYYSKRQWVVTRIPWAVAPKYVHFIREHMTAVLKVLAEKEKGNNDQ